MTSLTDRDLASPPSTAIDDASHGGSQQTLGDSHQTGYFTSTTQSESSSVGTQPSSASVTSGPPTPSSSALTESVLSPGGTRYPARLSSPQSSDSRTAHAALVCQAFAPHVSVLSSPDCEELMRHKGLNGGLLELLRPFGEVIPGRVVIRDSTGAGRAWDDFGVRFTGIKDGLEAPRMGQYRPARLRSGGDTAQIEQLVERQLDSKEPDLGRLSISGDELNDSPAFTLYQQKLLSGTILTPHETFAHPVALVIAISSRSPSPIEELRNLYAESNTGAYRLPPWVNNEYLRYYVLVHDEDFDDIRKSTTLYEQMKRPFGLHCHLLRVRSTQCLPSDEDGFGLPRRAWSSAAEDLTDMADLEDEEATESGQSRIFESDAIAVRSFVREMVTQSIIPSMERLVATWNDQVASRRRGISGRFMSLSKRFTPFGSRSNSPSTTSGSNYDSSGGFYRPDSPEALMRKLGDYAMMLRDYKLAQATYDLLSGDFKNDKAWRHYAGANEMAAISSLMTGASVSTRARAETIDVWLENAYYSYFSRCNSLFFAIRTIMLGAEFLKARDGSALDDAARWFSRLLDDRIVGPVGHALVLERIGGCFASRKGVGTLQSGSRRRKAAFWMTMATRAWLDMDKAGQAARCLDSALRIYGPIDAVEGGGLFFEGMRFYLSDLEGAVQGAASASKAADLPDENVEQTMEQVDQRPHRKSLSIAAISTTFDPLGVVPLTPKPAILERKDEVEADGFE
ncbi:hypothetical protein ANO11243_082590 [Dothideomycetidae sp. 11243]|nr:hypothetical protein ANO11243_082590 [fungal sp. No.11243]